jgi:ATP-dependent Lon protease
MVMPDIQEFPVALAEGEAIEPMMQIPSELPVLAAQGHCYLTPFMIVPLFVSRDRSIKAVEEALGGQQDDPACFAKRRK